MMLAETTTVEDTPACSWALVAAAQNGDTHAFGQLYERYRRKVDSFLHARLTDHGTVEDLVHETFVRAMRNLQTLRRQSDDPGTWFITIARHLLLDHVRSAKYRKEVITSTLDPNHHSPEEPENQVLDRIMAAELWSRAGALTPEQHLCLVLRFGYELSVEQTALRMRRRPAAVRALQHRAVRGLAKLIEEESWEPRSSSKA